MNFDSNFRYLERLVEAIFGKLLPLGVVSKANYEARRVLDCAPHIARIDSVGLAALAGTHGGVPSG